MDGTGIQNQISPDEQDIQREGAPNPNFKFSPEELRVLRQCNIESFYYRCLPLAAIFGTSAFYAVRLGYLKPSARWGPTPKVMVGAVMGYFFGKASYQKQCAEKLMKLPNSTIGEALRRRKGQVGLQESFAMESGGMLPSFSGDQSSIETQPKSFFDQDVRAKDAFYDAPPSQSGLDDTFRPSLDRQYTTLEDDLPSPSQTFTSYDELRKKNREEYEQKRSVSSDAFKRLGDPRTGPYTTQPLQPQSDLSRKPKTAYGDVWEE